MNAHRLREGKEPRSPRKPLPVLLMLGAVVALAGCFGSGPASARSTAPSSAVAPCTGVAPSNISHVVWILMENKSSGKVVDNAQAPYLRSIGDRCGLADNDHGVAHPSLPNYIALTSGDTHGITDDGNPSAHRLAGPSLFSQVSASGKSWKSYQESMPSNCLTRNSGSYAVRHNPATYYADLAAQCAKNDVPYGQLAADLSSNKLPAFSFVTPNLCHDMHDCGVSAGDSWLSAELPKLLASPAYRSGSTAVFVTWDEDDHTAANQIPLYVIAPSVVPGTRSGASFRHQQLLNATEQMLGLPALPGASGGDAIRSAFHLQ